MLKHCQNCEPLSTKRNHMALNMIIKTQCWFLKLQICPGNYAQPEHHAKYKLLSIVNPSHFLTGNLNQFWRPTETETCILIGRFGIAEYGKQMDGFPERWGKSSNILTIFMLTQCMAPPGFKFPSQPLILTETYLHTYTQIFNTLSLVGVQNL